MGNGCRRCVLASICCLALLGLAAYWLFVEIFPQVGVVLFSTCRYRRSTGWNGRLPGTSLVLAPPVPPVDLKRMPAQASEAASASRPIILWGTHHKTGTILSFHLTSVICARLGLCCALEPSYVNAVHLAEVVASEPGIALLYHDAWRVAPASILPPWRDWRFVHVQRHPLDMVLSAWRYHVSGKEPFTVPGDACLIAQKGKVSAVGGPRTTYTAWRYCQAFLCAGCCMAAHGLTEPRTRRTERMWRNIHGRRLLNASANARLASKGAVGRDQGRRPLADALVCRVRACLSPSSCPCAAVYPLACAALQPRTGLASVEAFVPANGTAGNSTLRRQWRGSGDPGGPATGVVAMGAFIYFDVWTMVHTAALHEEDPRALTVDLGDFLSDFAGTVHRLVTFLGTALPLASEAQRRSLEAHMGVFDIGRTTPYSLWTQFVHKHVTSTPGRSAGTSSWPSTAELRQVLLADGRLRAAYEPLVGASERLAARASLGKRSS